MSELISIKEQMNAVGEANIDDKVFEQIAKSGDWFPRLQLCTASSEVCKEEKVPVNNYAIIDGQNINALGKDVDVLVCGWRAKAMRIAGDAVVNYFEVGSSEFQDIVAESEIKDSGCMYGPEFLVYVPGAKKYATFFMASKSARREAPALKAKMYEAATLTAHFIKTAKYSWWAPQVRACSTPFDVPEIAEITEKVNAFKAEKSSEAGTVSSEEQTDRER